MIIIITIIIIIIIIIKDNNNSNNNTNNNNNIIIIINISIKTIIIILFNYMPVILIGYFYNINNTLQALRWKDMHAKKIQLEQNVTECTVKLRKHLQYVG